MLATTAINVQDTLDGFALNLSQPGGGPEPNDGDLLYILSSS
jgi:hypothetical protein